MVKKKKFYSNQSNMTIIADSDLHKSSHKLLGYVKWKFLVGPYCGQEGGAYMYIDYDETAY
jgi:hypothetical protein